MEKKKWYQSKAVWTGVAGAVAAIGGAVSGETTWMQAIQGSLAALSVVFVRTGMLK